MTCRQHGVQEEVHRLTKERQSILARAARIDATRLDASTASTQASMAADASVAALQEHCKKEERKLAALADDVTRTRDQIAVAGETLSSMHAEAHALSRRQQGGRELDDDVQAAWGLLAGLKRQLMAVQRRRAKAEAAVHKATQAHCLVLRSKN